MTTTAGKLLLLMNAPLTYPLPDSFTQHWWSSEGVLWQDAARTIPAVADGDLVGCIDDKVSGGVNAVQATAGTRPVLRIINGRKFIAFHANGVRSGNITTFASKRGCIFFNFRSLALSGQQFLGGDFGGAAPVYAAYTTISGATKFKWYDGTQRPSSAFDITDTPYVQQFWRNGDTNLDFYRNGTLADSLTLANTQPTPVLPFGIGGTPGASYDFIGLMRDIIITGDITNDQRVHIQNYLLQFPVPAAPIALGFGDSITAGTAASDLEHQWLSLVNANQKMAYKLQNSGIAGTVLQNTVQNSVAVIGGAAANNGQDTLTARVLSYAPTRVLLLYGLNDLRLNDAAFTTTTFTNSLTAVVNAIIANGTPASKIILGSPPYIPVASYALSPPFDGGSTVKHQAYRDAVAAVALAKSTGYIDVYQWMIDNGGDTLISGDGIHPNNAGHAAIANAFLSVL